MKERERMVANAKEAIEAMKRADNPEEAADHLGYALTVMMNLPDDEPQQLKLDFSH